MSSPLLQQLQAQLPHLGLPQSSRALVASVALGFSPPEMWIHSYMQRFRALLSELNPEGLVDVLRALSAANALPSHQWLTEFEQDLERRWVRPAALLAGPAESCRLAFRQWMHMKRPAYQCFGLMASHAAAPVLTLYTPITVWLLAVQHLVLPAPLLHLAQTTAALSSCACRFGFIGPVELSTSAFLLANLSHTPLEPWRERFLAEALKFRVRRY